MEYPRHLLLINILILLTVSSFLLEAKVPINKIDQLPLLSFKSQISQDPFQVLSSWNDSVHYCHWQGVTCGRRHPDRVTALVLNSKQLSGYVSPSLANLTFLQRIDLSDNQLGGNISEELGSLGRLRFVNLSINFLEGSIPSALGNCSKLEVISLRNNNLHGMIPTDLVKCKELKNINLGSNFLTGGISSTLGNLTSLIYLFLAQNNFDGHIPDSLGRLTKLSKLSLYQNNLSGPIPLTLGNLTNLSKLYLDQNNFTGHIPSVLGNLTNLSALYLYQNRLSGTIPYTLGNLNNLETLHLFDNSLSGFIPHSLGKLQNLQVFDIHDNNISGEIPHSFYNISTMVAFGFGYNQLEGTLPFDMCDAFPNFQYLLLSFNQFKGQIPPFISNCSALYEVELSNNYFSGIIPATLGMLKNLYRLQVDGNQLEAKRPNDWSFINALVNCTSLQMLDISSNQLQGTFPNSITNFSNIKLLSLLDNPITGTIPTEIGKLTNLETLWCDNMLLSGSIPKEIGYLIRLEGLDLSNNLLSGQIPQTFGNLTHLTQLFLNNNAFERSIPPELANMQSLELLNLSNNKLTGNIPREILGLTSLSISLDLSHNYLTDILPPEIGNLKNLQTISLSNNKLFGNLPSTIGGCQELQALYLDNNLFEGIIPSTMSNLGGLQILDVSNNSFSGQIPVFIGRMNLQYLNISFNNFQGELPREGIFKNVSGLDVRGNPKLCGGIPEIHLPPCMLEPLTQSHHFLRNVVLISTIGGSFICLVAVVWLLVSCYSRTKLHNNQQSDRAMKHELKHISYNELLQATENFSPANLIGRGTFGTVYKAVISFENVTTIALKVLNLEVHGASKSFFSECEALRNVRHRNLIKVLSSCVGIDHQGNDFKALVFEFMPNGSLAAWLHSNTDQPLRNLSLIQRLNIAIDVASALDYLHYHGPIPIVHCDLKPSNVLLDDNMAARVGDFGLARFLIQRDTSISQSMTSIGGIKGSIGYVPPEYGMGGRPSIEGDVYSYGILLLEMFTGLSPTDERLSGGLSLHKHVEMAFPEQVMDIIDPKLFSEIVGEETPHAPENIYGCLFLVIQCGLLCSKGSPKERITIKDAIKDLNSAKKKSCSSRRDKIIGRKHKRTRAPQFISYAIYVKLCLQFYF